MKKDDHDITDSPVSPEQLGGIIELITKGDISGKIAKDLFEIVYTEGGNPAEIVEARGMKQVTDTGAIEAAVDQIIADNPAQVEKAKANPKLVGWFVGQVMKATGGKANPKAVNEIVSAKLGNKNDSGVPSAFFTCSIWEWIDPGQGVDFPHQLFPNRRMHGAMLRDPRLAAKAADTIFTRNGFLRPLETLRDRGAFRFRPQHPDVQDQMHRLVVW